MSVQYRPELGTIGLGSGYPPSNDREHLTDTANSQQRPSYYATQNCHVDGQWQGAFGTKIKNLSSPLSPLSPSDSSQGVSENGPRISGGWSSVSYQSESSSLSEGSLEGHSNQEADYLGRQYRHNEQLKGSVGYQNSPSSVLRPLPHTGANVQGYPMSNRQQVLRQVPEVQYAQIQSNYAKRNSDMVQMLQVLESALLDDDEEDGDLSGSLVGGHDPASEGSWADTIEELLAADRSALESSMVTSTSTESDFGKQCRYGNTTSCPGAVSVRVEKPAPQKLVVETRSLPEQLLVACAEALSNNDMPVANVLIAQLNQVVSIYGDPMQRLAAYMVEGLVARVAASGKGLYKALRCKEPPTRDLLSAMQILYEVCPYFKFGYMAANGAIAEAFQNENMVHIIDFEIAQGTQWTTLIQALAARPGGPPHLRITGCDDPMPGPNPSAGVEMVGKRLGKLAEAVGVPFVFHPVAKKASDVEAWMLKRQTGEALAVNFALNLHHVPDESVCTENPRDRMLHMMKGLNPKVLTLVEQEANTNTAPFFPRFLETLSYYSAVFESLDITLARESKERVNVEQQCLARDIVNVIACEGAERVERHEMTGKWRARMTMAGFRPYPLSQTVNNTIKTLLESYSDKYRLKEDGGALFLGWQNRALIVSSAWQ
ncbi:hypothetical protein M758_UG204600 [Ceratodon purpureus]|nr:hypothetical protein M758_UG204600 [Ceratodon purpureus]